ncbi:hypothetical protein ACFWN2_28735 [Lentzea sp. NPDC058436]|uniref:hypothetical protein n=1 Tax=Lentzea sp. NPDC058436 TaxID=3346499 RepID=UPI003664EC38
MKKAVFALLGCVIAVGSSTPASAGPADDFCVGVTDESGQRTKLTCDVKPDSGKLKAARAEAIAANRQDLITWYNDAGWSTAGGWYEWWGTAGPCDREGYKTTMTGDQTVWRNKISSWRVWAPCDSVMSYDVAGVESSASRRDNGSVWYVGDDWNDTIEMFRVSLRP